MFCPKCGVENQEDAKLCRSCSWVLANMVMTAPVAKTSALAITSMILGILSFCTFFITAPLAIIFGIISLIMIVKSKGQLKGIGFAISGIAVPVAALPIVAIVGLLMGILSPALARAQSLGQRAVCMSNLKQLGVTTMMYADNNKGQYPTADKWCDLLEPYYKNNNVLICPATRKKMFGYIIDPNTKHQCSYAINSNVKRDCRFPATTVLFFESNLGWNQSGGAESLTTQNHGNNGCNVLFCDAHVEFVRTEDVNKLRWTAGP